MGGPESQEEVISHESTFDAGSSLDGGSGIGAVKQRVGRAVAERERTVPVWCAGQFPIRLVGRPAERERTVPIRFAGQLSIGFVGRPAGRIPSRLAEQYAIGVAGRSTERTIPSRLTERL